jgi:hypothetical protein
MAMLRNRSLVLGLALLALAAIAFPACNGKDPGGVGYNHAYPVPERTIVTITSNKGSLPAGGTSPATLTVTAVAEYVGVTVADDTVVGISSNLGSFGRVGGPNVAQLLTRNGQATVSFFPGNTRGVARIQAEVLYGVGNIEIEIR